MTRRFVRNGRFGFATHNGRTVKYLEALTPQDVNSKLHIVYEDGTMAKELSSWTVFDANDNVRNEYWKELPVTKEKDIDVVLCEQIIQTLDNILRTLDNHNLRYFTHAKMFGDNTAYVVCEGANNKHIVSKSGAKSYDVHYNLKFALDAVNAKAWKEITKKEAEALVGKTWMSTDGRTNTVKTFSDRHLANVITHMLHYKYSLDFCQECIAEATARGLSHSFLEGAPYPWRDQTTGKWKVWSFAQNQDVVVSGGGKDNVLN